MALKHSHCVLARISDQAHGSRRWMEPAWSEMRVRRGLNTVLRHIATRTDIVFENVLSHSSQLHVISIEPALAGVWFRLIELAKSS